MTTPTIYCDVVRRMSFYSSIVPHSEVQMFGGMAVGEDSEINCLALTIPIVGKHLAFLEVIEHATVDCYKS